MKPSRLLLPLTLLPYAALAQHTSNWAVLVSTSRFWFNYRHLANVLSMYRTVKRLGIPDSQIILMLSDDIACNPRNAFPGTVYNNADRALDLYGDNIEVDYRGYEVTVENFIRLLTDRVAPDTPRSKRLLTDDRSNIFIYMTGHGGNEFLKFQDAEEISAFDIADAFEQMWEKKRYHEMLFMVDTCQANTMYSKFYSPNILATGSSKLDESSYSHHADNDVGVAVIDRYTYYNLEFLENEVKTASSSRSTMKDLFDSYDTEKIHSTPGVRTDLFRRELGETLITDFFGNVQNVELEGEAGGSWDEDLLELSRLAVNFNVPRRNGTCGGGGGGGEAVEAAAAAEKERPQKVVRREGAVRIVEEEGWNRNAVGVGALLACAAAWVAGSALSAL
ncbi:peptidase C13 family-domain-containing protein [Morchella snyderi]|nr:peptidase C13 family-domain-containing protein [Morchella snyderi]